MSTIDKLISLIPSGWFSDTAKTQGGILYALLSAFAKGLDYISDGIAYVKAQTRIKTAFGDNLDKISTDFFGTGLLRKPGQGDDGFKAKILNRLFQEKATRKGMVQALADVGATVLEIYEPCIDGFFTDYSMSDRHRISDLNPYTAILFISRPLNPINTNILFSDYNYSDYSYMVDSNSQVYQIVDSDVFSVVEENKVAGTQVFVVLDPISIGNTTGDNEISDVRYYVPPITLPAPNNFILDSSPLDGTDILV